MKSSTPIYAWEKAGGGVNEAPVALVRNGKVFITYSASACSSDDYALPVAKLNRAQVVGEGMASNGKVAGAGTLTYPNTGWGVFGTATLRVQLAAGGNTVQLNKGTLFSEVDYLEVR